MENHEGGLKRKKQLEEPQRFHKIAFNLDSLQVYVCLPLNSQRPESYWYVRIVGTHMCDLRLVLFKGSEHSN